MNLYIKNDVILFGVYRHFWRLLLVRWRMNEDFQFLIFPIFMIFLFCCYGGLLLYFCHYLRKREVTDLRFIQTIFLSMTKNVQQFYKTFYALHSEDYGIQLTKALIFCNISSLVLIFVSPVVYALYLSI
jgi:hypothetical protein